MNEWIRFQNILDSRSSFSSTQFEIMTRWRLVLDKLFGKYLLATNTICSSILMAAGDTIEQKIRKIMNEDKLLAHNWQRTSSNLLVNLSHLNFFSKLKFFAFLFIRRKHVHCRIRFGPCTAYFLQTHWREISLSHSEKCFEKSCYRANGSVPDVHNFILLFLRNCRKATVTSMW